MTTPAKTTKAAASKAATEVIEPSVVEPVADDSVVTPTDGPDTRIPSLLANNSILGDFCARYLAVFDEISEYNKEVLAEKSSEWNAGKVLEKAREFARPTEKDVKPNETVKSALEKYEDMVNKLALARRDVLDITSKELGITLSATADRNPETEAPLREKRKIAIEIGTQLSTIAKMTTDDSASDAVTTFLAQSPLPAIGRDQIRKFGEEGKATPKYRVHITVTNSDGQELLSEDGFTKTALALTKPVFNYERGAAPKPDVFRTVWEKAGNTPEAPGAVSPVEFEDNGLKFVLTKK